MVNDTNIHHRRSIRLQGYDYTQAGAYFITVCTQDRECLFGDVVTVGATPRGCPTVVLNDAGRMVQTVWDEIPFHYPGMEINEFVVMPNHIHGIVVIVGATPRGCPVLTRGCPASIPCGCPDPDVGTCGQAQGPAPTANTGPLSVGDIVHRFKTMTTKRYADGVKQSGWRSFPGRLWQRNYWEHIIRDEMELNRIREYIRNNPVQWESDRLNMQKNGPVDPLVAREPVVTYPAEGWMV